MTRNIKILLVVILLSLPFWWGINVFQKDLESYFCAQISQPIVMNFKPTHHKEGSEAIGKRARLLNYKINAKSVISVKITNEGEKILFEKNPDEPLPIASLTKLMTALVSLEIYNPSQLLYISENAVSQEEDRGKLKIGERLSVNNLLHIALLESSNDAAFALSEGIYSPKKKIGTDNFVSLMNKEAKDLSLKNTHFANPTGLDGSNEGLTNYSTARDLSKLAFYIIENKPEIFEISNKSQYLVLTPEGNVHHFIPANIDKLVNEMPGLVGGKTGFTDEAGGCILTVFKSNKGDYLINVILGTSTPDERFSETKDLVNNLKNSNLW